MNFGCLLFTERDHNLLLIRTNVYMLAIQHDLLSL
jgi:hypothetical protein